MSEIRPATEADWAQIWPFWREIVRAGETYAYPHDATSDEAAAMWMERPPGATVVWVDDHGAVLGSAKMGPNRPGNGDHIGTASFVVSPAGRGKGVGRALGDYVVKWHRRNGFHGIQFNAVVETNETAVRLWKSLGFNVIGTVPESFRHPEHGLVGLHVMYLPLQVNSPARDGS